jgi:mono/diheme cytochrome c family protein
MRGFVVGVIVTLLVIFGGGYFYLTTGHFDPRAVGNTPSTFERRIANRSVDEWVDDHASKQANPFQANTQNIMDGSMTYDKHCGFCHGTLKQPQAPMKNKFYPSVPQLMAEAPDDPDSNLFYVIKYGTRYTAMPGWDGVLSDDDIWKTVVFIKNSGQMKDSGQPPSPAPTAGQSK